MPAKLNRCYWQSSPATDTDPFDFSSAVSGFRSPDDSGAVNATAYAYIAENGSPPTEWEIGIGTYTQSSGELSRDTIVSSSNSDLAVNFSSAPKVRMGVPLASDFDAETIASLLGIVIDLATGRIGFGVSSVEDLQDSRLTIKPTVGGLGDELLVNGDISSETVWQGFNGSNGDYVDLPFDGWHFDVGKITRDASDFGISYVQILDRGSGYTVGDSLTLEDDTGGATVQVDEVDGDSQGIVSVTITDRGVGNYLGSGFSGNFVGGTGSSGNAQFYTMGTVGGITQSNIDLEDPAYQFSVDIEGAQSFNVVVGQNNISVEGEDETVSSPILVGDPNSDGELFIFAQDITTTFSIDNISLKKIIPSAAMALLHDDGTLAVSHRTDISADGDSTEIKINSNDDISILPGNNFIFRNSADNGGKDVILYLPGTEEDVELGLPEQSGVLALEPEDGASDTFTSNDGKTVTVVNGRIVSIE